MVITEIISEQNLSEANSLINSSNNIVIVAHISPDGDAMGSSLAMCQLLTNLGKKTTVVLNDSYSDNLSWMPGANKIIILEENINAAQKAINESQLIICLDFNQAKRMGPLADLVLNHTAPRILIDHHLYPDSFCDVIISHPIISSTSELVYRFIAQSNLTGSLDKNAATCIYTGMMTDTGAFTYNSNSPEIYIIISELLKFGINKDEIYDKVNNTFSESRERLMGYTINEKMRIYPEYQAAIISLTKKELEEYNFKKGDSEGFVNIPLSIKGIIFSVFFREDSEYIKVSLRSKGDFPANKVSENHFNGGGHKNAAGGEFFGTMDEAIELLEAVLPKYKEFLN